MTPSLLVYKSKAELQSLLSHAMASKPHFVLFPFMAQGHMIPMIDLAKLLARHGSIITIITTPNNSARYHSVLARAINSGSQIHVALLEFPSKQVGLPDGCDNFDLLPSFLPSLTDAFHRAASLLYGPSQKLIRQLQPPPNCIISDLFLPWTLKLARTQNIPRLVFYSFTTFFFRCMNSLNTAHDLFNSSSPFVTLSDLPGSLVFRKSQLPKMASEQTRKLRYEMMEADRDSDGVIFNGFEEMETEYAAEYRNNRNSPENVWFVGPVSLYDDEHEVQKAERGEKSSIDKYECIKWLDSKQPSSVIYVSMGSLCNLSAGKLIELGLGLELSNKAFIWAIRKGNLTTELEKWLEEYDFERRVENRGMVIRGWAPQVLILSHSAIGCFMMHCGWNSTIEGICAGVPMITWPLFVDQIFNEKMIVEILRIGVSAGEEKALNWGFEEEEEREMVVGREKVREAIEMAMDGDGRDEMRERCKKLAVMAKRAVEEGGSSCRNVKLLIQHIVAYGGGMSNNGSCTNSQT